MFIYNTAQILITFYFSFAFLRHCPPLVLVLLLVFLYNSFECCDCSLVEGLLKKEKNAHFFNPQSTFFQVFSEQKYTSEEETFCTSK